ncbi:MAG TPA: ester cyclase, partial [Opitutaceae bacterium]|nr:ester cyclase [Opitutaceae bacterium]
MAPVVTIEENKAIYREFIEVIFNQGRLERLGEFLAPDYALHDAPPGTPAGAAAVGQIVTMFRSAFPDLKVTL